MVFNECWDTLETDHNEFLHNEELEIKVLLDWGVQEKSFDVMFVSMWSFQNYAEYAVADSRVRTKAKTVETTTPCKFEKVVLVKLDILVLSCLCMLQNFTSSPFLTCLGITKGDRHIQTLYLMWCLLLSGWNTQGQLGIYVPWPHY